MLYQIGDSSNRGGHYGCPDRQGFSYGQRKPLLGRSNHKDVTYAHDLKETGSRYRRMYRDCISQPFASNQGGNLLTDRSVTEKKGMYREPLPHQNFESVQKISVALLRNKTRWRDDYEVVHSGSIHGYEFAPSVYF
ncbi:MAG TPA: hypothetical protein VFA00_12105 [Actinomycetota bacterium]|jgi:hypothetical protein|nr:hypothetical protein [Actinomycetota bacterium]